MNNFLENSSIPAYGIALLFALFKYPKYYDTPIKFFPVLLMYTFLNEILGWIIRHDDKYSFVFNDFYADYNMVIYNIYNIVFFAYFIYVFRAYLPDGSIKKLLLILGAIFLIVSLINPMFQDFMIEAQIGIYVIGALVLITAIIFYFVDLQKRSGRWFHRKDLMSWIGLGMLIFYTGYLPIKIYRHFSAIHMVREPLYIRKIQLTLILLMYVCIIAGFLMMRRRKLVSE
ncbi:hypothetical protein [Poritiphilus flavus]|uniref:Uncharacterized protein n=1 Tax=Poritiphilus flavus TaxID=2697053 RepID=A0A6L9E930_9FLAO|nr:hypothetical protein [Poritiphilus flavus]NAS11101.1 hypothetical protein [Poritiphilus flavus]